MTPPFEELFCFAVVAGYILWQRRQMPDRPLLIPLLLVAVAAWLTEESCIRWYGFYSYSDSWKLVIGNVPLAVVVVWPVVIHSAGVLARHLSAAPARAALLTGFIVLSDAALIEPVAVKAGLWSWSEPGLFAVPPIAIIGWAIFATVCAASNDVGSAGRQPWRQLSLLLVAPVVTHSALLALWWGGLRWLSQPLPSWPAGVLVWIVAAATAAVVLRRGLWVPMGALLQRLPGAAFFFVLLALRCTSDPALLVYATAFAPPYLVLMAVAATRGRAGNGRSAR